MNTPLNKKSAVEEIKARFDQDVKPQSAKNQLIILYISQYISNN